MVEELQSEDDNAYSHKKNAILGNQHKRNNNNNNKSRNYMNKIFIHISSNTRGKQKTTTELVFNKNPLKYK